MIYGNDTIEIVNRIAGHEADNGDWVEGGEVIADTLQCDAEPAQGNANVIIAPDGKTIVYAYIVCLDVSCNEIAYGTDIILHRRGMQPQRLQAKGFQRYSTLCKLWL